MTNEAEREVLEVDCLIVGAGPAGLSAAIRLADLVKEHEERRAGGQSDLRDLSECTILVIEKGERVGGHSLSGAVLDPSALRLLIPDAADQGAPLGAPVSSDEFHFFTSGADYRIPFTPPGMSHHGCNVISLFRLVGWLGEQAEARGVEVMPGFAGREPLWNGEQLVGVRTGDKGIDKNGERKANFEAGVDIRARVTVLAEGPRGSLTKVLVRERKLDAGRDPQIYSLGVKEVWKVPAGRLRPGSVVHTMGYPLPDRVFGGGFIYQLDEEHVSVGLVTSLDYGDPRFDPHREFQRWKLHPYVRKILEGGEIVRYGAKVIPEGGYYALPRPYLDGGLLVGDSAGFLNVQRLKGIHLGMHSGMHAAETIYQALRDDDVSAPKLADYERRLKEGPVHEELHHSRNFRPAFEKGLWSGMANAGLLFVSNGNFPGKGHALTPDFKQLRRLAQLDGRPGPAGVSFDSKYTYDRDNDVFYSGTRHEEDQPPHLLVADTEICRTRCREEYGNPCENFCPAHVYEMVEDEERGGKRLILHPTNCVHCKTCDVMDPYEIITWVPPEGGGGPDYIDM